MCDVQPNTRGWYTWFVALGFTRQQTVVEDNGREIQVGEDGVFKIRLDTFAQLYLEQAPRLVHLWFRIWSEPVDINNTVMREILSCPSSASARDLSASCADLVHSLRRTTRLVCFRVGLEKRGRERWREREKGGRGRR